MNGAGAQFPVNMFISNTRPAPCRSDVADDLPTGNLVSKGDRVRGEVAIDRWEDEIRPRLATAKGVPLSDIRGDAVGDLRILRNVILHARGRDQQGRDEDKGRDGTDADEPTAGPLPLTRRGASTRPPHCPPEHSKHRDIDQCASDQDYPSQRRDLSGSGPRRR